MRHADHGLLHALRAGALDQVIEHRDHREPALAGKALLPDVLRVQVALERFRRGQPLQDVPLLRGRCTSAARESAPAAPG